MEESTLQTNRRNSTPQSSQKSQKFEILYEIILTNLSQINTIMLPASTTFKEKKFNLTDKHEKNFKR